MTAAIAEPIVDTTRQVARQGWFAALRTEGRSAWIASSGRSMTPLVRPGDHLLVEFGAIPTRRGDVVLFERHGRYIAHRVVDLGIRDGIAWVRAKGDAEALADEPVATAEVAGLVRATRTGGTGAPRSRGLEGRRATAIGALSWAGDRLVRVARRVTRRLPAAIGRPILSVTIGVASITTRSGVAVCAWPTGEDHDGKEVR